MSKVAGGTRPQDVEARVTCKKCGEKWYTARPDVYNECPNCKSKDIKVEW